MFLLKRKLSKPTDLERSLGLRFKDRGLLEQALAHPSFLNENPDFGLDSYQRLEFLGDSVLNLAITREVFHRCPDLDEGHLTRLRSSLVRGVMLARVAREIGLGSHLKLGKGEEGSGGRRRDSILAAAVESLVGAVFMDRGYEPARKLVLRILQKEMDRLLQGSVPEDPKSRLQHVSQERRLGQPRYRTVTAQGPNHARIFKIEVVVNGQVMGSGTGVRKAEAESKAAREGLRHLGAAE